jgi:GNAT superfamily N-acetyltransferase
MSFRPPGTPPEEARIAVQSILTLNKTIGKEAHEKIISLLRQGSDVSLTEILGPDFLKKFYAQNPVIACDNVEGHRNYIRYLMANDAKVIENIYREFFSEYIKEQKEFTAEKVVIGKGYSDYLRNLPEIDNETLPLAQISYSDNIGPKSLSLIEQEKREVLKRTGVSDISWQDSLAVAYLEEKIYGKDNPELIEGLTTIQKILTASGLASEKEGVGKLTVGHFDEKGILDGYLLAYLAREHESGDEKIYFHDVAVNPEKQKTGIGMEMFMELLDRISKNEKLSLRPLVMRCREKTSYPIIKKQAEKLGFEIVLDRDFEEAGEILHRIEIRKK